MHNFQRKKLLNWFLSQQQNYKFWRQNLTLVMTSQGKTKRLKQHKKCGLSQTMVMPSFISFGIMCLCLLTEWEEKHPLGTIVKACCATKLDWVMFRSAYNTMQAFPFQINYHFPFATPTEFPFTASMLPPTDNMTNRKIYFAGHTLLYSNTNSLLKKYLLSCYR